MSAPPESAALPRSPARRIAATGTVAGLCEPSERGMQCRIDLDPTPGGEAPLRVAAYVQTGPLRLAPGDRVLLTGLLQGFPPARNEYEFDYRAYMESRGVAGSLSVDWGAPFGRSSRVAFLPSRLVSPLRTSVEELLAAGGLSSESKALMAAMLLGEQADIPPNVRDLYSASGVAHLFSVSGLHLACLAAILFLLARGALRLLPPLPGAAAPKIGLSLAWAGALLFLLVTDSPTSCVRAFIMLTGYLAARLCDRDYDMGSWLAASAVTILAWRERAILEAAFQLTTSSVAALALLARPRPDADGSWTTRGAVLCPSSPLLGKAAQLLRASARTSAAATAATLPFVWWHFSMVPPAGILANLIAVPLASFIVLPAGLAYALGLGHVPFLTTVVQLAIGHTLFVLEAFLSTIVDVAGVWTPPWPGPLLAGLAGAAGLHAACGRSTRWRLASLLLASLVLLGSWAAGKADRAPLVHQFHVGEGDSALLRTGDGRTILIDGGPEASGRKVLLPYLRKKGWTRLDLLIITHGHADHWAGIERVASSLQVCRIATTNSPEALAAARRVAARASPCGRSLAPPIQALHAGAKATIGEAEIRVLWPLPPPFPTPDTENDRSLVLFLHFPALDLLLTGDVESGSATNQITRNLRLLRSSSMSPLIYKAPHHGHRSRAQSRLLDVIAPAVMLVPSEGPKVAREIKHLRMQSGSQPLVRISGIDGFSAIVFHAGEWLFPQALLR
jgi:competence protein ComEC